MTQAYTFASVNINALRQPCKLYMLRAWILKNDVDILCLQEVAFIDFSFLPEYQAIVNVNDKRRGTAILVKHHIEVTNVRMLDSTRGISLMVRDLLIINIYAPSGSRARAERQQFYAVDIVQLFTHTRTYTVFTGDFNAVTDPSETTAPYYPCPALKTLLDGLSLKDAWNKNSCSAPYTYYHARGASRLDRMYLSGNLSNALQMIDTVPTEFTNHMALVSKLRLHSITTPVGPRRWRIYAPILLDEELRQEFRTVWSRITSHKNKYKDTLEWWLRYGKIQAIKCVKWYSAAKNRFINDSIEFYYRVMRNFMDLYHQSDNIFVKLQRVKAKIRQLQCIKFAKLTIATQSPFVVYGENPSIYHLIRATKRRARKVVSRMYDNDGAAIEDITDITSMFLTYFRELYEDQTTEEYQTNCALSPGAPQVVTGNLILPMTEREVYDALCSGKKHTSPGLDGLSREFYISLWDIIKLEITEIVNDAIRPNRDMTELKGGEIVLIPKKKNPTCPEDFRPITLLNVDYKIITKCVKNRLQPFLTAVIGRPQSCSVPGKCILNNLCAVRDTIAEATLYKHKQYVISVDFDHAFDRVFPNHILRTMHDMGFQAPIVELMGRFLCGSSSRININGYLSERISLRKGVRQGCPLSMLLFIIALEPLLMALQRAFSTTIKIFAYADDLTIVGQNEIPPQDIIRLISGFADTAGLVINMKKTKVMFLDASPGERLLSPLQTVDELKILGIRFSAQLNKIAKSNWVDRINAIRGMASLDRYRDLTLQQRVIYINTFQFSRLYYLCQVFPPLKISIQQLKSISGWFLWTHFPLRTARYSVTQPKTRGGLGLVDVELQTRLLFIRRQLIVLRDNDDRQIDTILTTYYRLLGRSNPPAMYLIDPRYRYIKFFITELCYIPTNLYSDDSISVRTIYNYFIQQQYQVPRVVLHNTTVNWSRVWSNYTNAVLTERQKELWYLVVHDIIPTNKRLFDLNMKEYPDCDTCGSVDTILHRITECGQMATWWEWTIRMLVARCDIPINYFNINWFLRPEFTLQPSEKHTFVLWVLATVMEFVFPSRGSYFVEEFKNFFELRLLERLKYVNILEGEKVYIEHLLQCFL